MTFQYLWVLNKWLEKTPWLINIEFYDVIVTDMFHKYRIRGLKVFFKVSQYPQESVYVGVFY